MTHPNQQFQELIHYDEQLFESRRPIRSSNIQFIKLCTVLHLQQIVF